MQKKRLANIIIWASVFPLFFLYWGLSSFADTYAEKIVVTCINVVLCAALLCWVIIYTIFLKKKNTDKRFPWGSCLLYAGLWFIFFALNLVGIFVLFQLQATFVCGVFIAFGLACLFARLVFNFISKTEFFNKTEENIALFIALLLAAFTIAAYFQPSYIANFFVVILMGCISILLIALMIKKFVVEQIKFISIQSIMNFIFLLLAAIATSIATIYFLFWKSDAESQDLFNAVMGVFAGLVGGALTLAGVAWTIKSEREKDRREEVLKCKPMFRYCDALNKNPSEDIQNFFFIDGHVAEKKYTISEVYFKNFGNSNFIIESIEVNNILLKSLEIAIIEKEKFFRISFCLGEGRGIESFLLNIKDILGNPYRFELIRNIGGEIAGIREIIEG